MKEAQTEALGEDDGDIRYGYICKKNTVNGIQNNYSDLYVKPNIVSV